MSDIHIDPDHLTRSGGTLESFGQKLHAGGDKLAAAGHKLAASASGDRTGIGATLTKFFGKATEIGGKVVSEGGRVAERSGHNLKETAKSIQAVDQHYERHFSGTHQDRASVRSVHGGGTTTTSSASGGGSKVHAPGSVGHGGSDPGAHHADPGGGAGVHLPPTPPGGGGPGGGGGGPAGGRNLGPSWREEWDKHFTPKERQELDNAMHKLSEEPHDRGVPGSGRLTQHERELMARAQQHVTIGNDTPMQKVIPPGDVDKYLKGDYKEVGGFVARQQDATHLNTPAALVQGNRLDYANSPYHPNMDRVNVIEFPAKDPELYKTPLGAPVATDHGALDRDPSVRRASDHMHDAARTVGLDPTSYNRSNYSWPYSGVGVTADPNGVPEREMSKRMDIPHGAQMVEYDRNGHRTISHVFDQDLGWVPAS
ncbi:hypothetical protein AB0G02_20105 [Actinosynnema sp. NPDC023658]|uniref:hypothetical protein n=1 Tax=Actinosynnema sp. NPDC023658 TaxID=3155465 RepID=UPI0034076AD2